MLDNNKNDKNGKMTIPTSPERKTEPRVSKIDPRKKALVIVIVPAPTSKESLFGNRQNKSLFLRFQRWLVLSYRGSPRVGRVVCPHLRVLNDLIFLLQLVNTLCKGVRCVMIIKKGGNYRKRQDEAKDNCSKENVKTKVLLEGKGHLVEIVEDHFL